MLDCFRHCRLQGPSTRRTSRRVRGPLSPSRVSNPGEPSIIPILNSPPPLSTTSSGSWATNISVGPTFCRLSPKTSHPISTIITIWKTRVISLSNTKSRSPRYSRRFTERFTAGRPRAQSQSGVQRRGRCRFTANGVQRIVIPDGSARASSSDGSGRSALADDGRRSILRHLWSYHRS